MNEVTNQKSKIKLIITILLIFIAGILAQFFLNPVMQIKGLIDRDQKIVDKVKELAIVPADEPAVFPVADSEILKNTDPVVYAGVQNGDFVVIYNDKAITQRHYENKNVNIVNINLEELSN
jgi:hypothetical protein